MSWEMVGKPVTLGGGGVRVGELKDNKALQAKRL